MTDLNRSLLEKRSKKPKKATQSHFSSWKCSRFVTHRKHLAGKFYPMPLTHQTWLLPITTLLVCIARSPAYWAELRFLRRCEKMFRWMVRSKGEWFSLAWYLQIAQKIEKCITRDGAYFELGTLCHSFDFNVFYKEKSARHFCASGDTWNTPEDICLLVSHFWNIRSYEGRSFKYATYEHVRSQNLVLYKPHLYS